MLSNMHGRRSTWIVSSFKLNMLLTQGFSTTSSATTQKNFLNKLLSLTATATTITTTTTITTAATTILSNTTTPISNTTIVPAPESPYSINGTVNSSVLPPDIYALDSTTTTLQAKSTISSETITRYSTDTSTQLSSSKQTGSTLLSTSETTSSRNQSLQSKTSSIIQKETSTSLTLYSTLAPTSVAFSTTNQSELQSSTLGKSQFNRLYSTPATTIFFLPTTQAPTELQFLSSSASKSTTKITTDSTQNTPITIFPIQNRTTAVSTTNDRVTEEPTSKTVCFAKSFNRKRIRLDFQNTAVFDLALSSNICKNFGRPKGTAVCTVPSYHTFEDDYWAYFDLPHAVPCNVTLLDLGKKLTKNTLADLMVLTANNTILTPSNVTSAVNILGSYSQSNKLGQVNEKSLRDVTYTVSNLAFGAIQLESKTNASMSPVLKPRLLQTLKNFVSRATLPASNDTRSINVITPFVNIQIQEVPPNRNTTNENIKSDVVFYRNSSTGNPGGFVSFQNLSFAPLDVSITSLFTLFGDATLFMNESLCTSQVIAVGKSNSSYSVMNFTLSFGDIKDSECLMNITNAAMISGNISCCNCAELRKWDNTTFQWITDNSCKLAGNSGNKFECESSGTFAIFFSSQNIPTSFELSIFSYVGCAISTSFLMMTLIIHLKFRQIRKKRTTKIQVNICFCLLAVYLSFSVGTSMWSHGPTCDFVAFVTHYSILSTFAWMSANSYKMLKMFAEISYNIHSHTKKMYLLCYCIPLAISLANILLKMFYLKEDKHLYSLGECNLTEDELNNHACWLHGDSQLYSFLLPVGAALLFNIIIFGFLLKIVIFKKQKIKSNRKATRMKDRVINASAMATLMGLTWIFGYFLLITHDETYQSIMQWLFSVINTLLGVGIFYLSCFRRKDIRKIWWPRKNGHFSPSFSSKYQSSKIPKVVLLSHTALGNNTSFTYSKQADSTL